MLLSQTGALRNGDEHAPLTIFRYDRKDIEEHLQVGKTVIMSLYY